MPSTMKYTILWIISLCAIACGLLVYESDYLWKLQEMNLFLQTSLFFKEQMVVPAGMLSYVGTWFTQFLYYPLVGVSMLCGWWLLLLFMLKRAFDIPAGWASLLLIPVALLLITNVDLGYWLFFLKLRGHVFLTTIATVSVVGLLWAFRSLPDKYCLRAIFIMLTCAVGYPLMGIYALASALLMAVWSWRLMSRGRAVTLSLVALLAIITVPLVCYRYVYHETNIANIYYAGLPLFYITEEYPQYYIPYYLLALFMLVMVCLPRPGQREEPQAARDGQKAKGGKKGKVKNEAGSARRWIPLAIQAGVLAVVAWGVVHFWYTDENFRHEIKMMHLIEKNDWEGVLREAATQSDEPTRSIVMMRNLALSRIGRQGDLMYQYRNGAKPYNAPFPMRTMLEVGMLSYYHYGLENSCNRLTTEMGVEFGWKAEHMKYLVRSALLSNEKKAARKYINILKKTLFFEEWASEAEEMLNDPSLIARNREMEPITHMMHYKNTASGNQGFVERFIMTQLVNNSYPADPVFQEQSLLAALWLKEPEAFWYHFNIYTRLHPKGPIPVAYQEAAYLFAMMAGMPNIDKMPFNESVKDTFNKFFQTYSKYEGVEATEIRKMKNMPYTNNFYYDYHVMSQLPEY